MVRAEMLKARAKIELRAEFCTGGCEDRTWAREAEKFPLLETAARQQLEKTQQARKGLAGAVVICES
jgi:hypothetical protein